MVLDFENVPGGSVQNTFGEMPQTNGHQDYLGFKFDSNLEWIDSVGSHWNFGAKSGQFTLFNPHAGFKTVFAADRGDFTFGGLWAKKWGTAPESGGAASLFGTLEGWKNGAPVWSVNTALNGSYQFFGAQSGLIDELRLDFGTYFLVDDLALNENTISPVPLPAGGVLLLSAVLAAGAVSRRRAAKS